jgi:hypothetical protein
MMRYVMALPPTLARLLAEAGYTKESIKQWFWENARLPWDTLTPANQEQVKGYAEDGRLPGITLEDCKPGGMLPVFTLGAPQPEGDRLTIFVAGGSPGNTLVWHFLGPENQQLTKLIHGATLTKAGRN